MERWEAESLISKQIDQEREIDRLRAELAAEKDLRALDQAEGTRLRQVWGEAVADRTAMHIDLCAAVGDATRLEAELAKAQAAERKRCAEIAKKDIGEQCTCVVCRERRKIAKAIEGE